MSEMTTLRNNFNVEEIVEKLFELIKQKDLKALDKLHNKCMVVSKEINSINFNDLNLEDKYSQLELYAKDLLELAEVFKLLDKKIDDEIKDSVSLSQNDKKELESNFLYTIRTQHMNIASIKSNCENALSMIEKILKEQDNVNQNSEKPSFFAKIKAIRNNFTKNNNKNELK